MDHPRQVAEVVVHAHDQRVIHRSLSLQSILLTEAESDRPQVKVFNWQAGYRDASSSTGCHGAVTATSHVERFVEDAPTAYVAPESLNELGVGEHLDVFSLGAIAYHIFSRKPPGADAVELGEKLRGSCGLQISSVLNGASDELQMLVQEATHPIVANRTGSVADFLASLDLVEEELTKPDDESLDDPTIAQRGDTHAGGFLVDRRVGKGACSIALLVKHEGSSFALKVANDPEQNARLEDEAEGAPELLDDALREPRGAFFVPIE